jgi:hypothetical protein
VFSVQAHNSNPRPCLLVPVLQFPDLLLGPEVIGLVPDIMVPLLKFPVYIACTVNLTDAGLKNQVVINANYFFGLQNGSEANTFVTKMADYRYIELFLAAFYYQSVGHGIFFMIYVNGPDFVAI